MDGPHRQRLLRRRTDGRELHEVLRRLPVQAQGDRQPLDTARTDLGGVQSGTQPGVPPLAADCPLLRAHLETRTNCEHTDRATRYAGRPLVLAAIVTRYP